MLIVLTACKLDEAGDTGTPGTAGPTDQTLAGDWVSRGDDVAPILSADPLNYRKIEARFGDDGTYEVVATDADGASVTLTGTYAADNATSPGTITLEQATPYSATAEGIWEVAGTVLTYEVAQTVPDYGWSPPTPSTGFGSTAGDGLEAGVNVQTYVAAE
jgi:hypothetical protein